MNVARGKKSINLLLVQSVNQKSIEKLILISFNLLKRIGIEKNWGRKIELQVY